MRNLSFEKVSVHEEKKKKRGQILYPAFLVNQFLGSEENRMKQSFSHRMVEIAAEKRKQKIQILCLLLKPTSWVALNKSLIVLMSSVTQMTNE